MLVFAGVRLFRKPLAKHQQADQSVIAPKDRHQAFRSKGPQIAGRLVTLWDVPGLSALSDLPEQWQRGWNCVRLSGKEGCAKAERELRPRQCGWSCVELSGHWSEFRDEVSISGFQITSKGFRIQSTPDVFFQQHREFAAVGDGTRFLRQVLQDDPRVIRATEKGAVDARCSPPNQRRGNPHQSDAKYKAEAQHGIRECPDQTRNSVCEEPNSAEPKGQEQNREAALH